MRNSLDGTTAIVEREAEFDDLPQKARKRMREVAILVFEGQLIASLRELGQNVTILTVFSGNGGAGAGSSLTGYQREALGFGTKAIWPVTEAFNRAHIGADFPVYGVHICVDSGNFCQYMAPSTLPPGALGTFSFPTNLLGVPDWKISWDVIPTGEP